MVTAAQNKVKSEVRAIFKHTKKGRHTFGIKASALPQRVTVFNILSPAPPETTIRVKN